MNDRQIPISIYSFGMLITIALYLAFFDTFKNQTENFTSLFQNLPSWYFAAFKIDPTVMLSTAEGYISTEMYGIVWPLILALLTISTAGSLVTAEIEQGSIGLLLHFPISRFQIFAAKYLAGVSILMRYVAVTVLAVMPVLALYHYSFNPQHFLYFALFGFLAGWAIYSFSFLLACIMSEKGHVYFTAGGILIIMYIVNIFSSLNDNLDWLKYSSFFYYFDPLNALVNAHVDVLGIVIFISVAITSTTLAAVTFVRRDFVI